jgi:hypothetical protein
LEESSIIGYDAPVGSHAKTRSCGFRDGFQAHGTRVLSFDPCLETGSVKKVTAMGEITDLVTVLEGSETNNAIDFVVFLVLMIAGAAGVGLSPSTLVVAVTFRDRDGRLLGIILPRRVSAAFADIIGLAKNLGPEGEILDSIFPAHPPPRLRQIGISTPRPLYIVLPAFLVIVAVPLSQPFVDAALASDGGSPHTTPLPQPLLVGVASALGCH